MKQNYLNLKYCLNLNLNIKLLLKILVINFKITDYGLYNTVI